VARFNYSTISFLTAKGNASRGVNGMERLGEFSGREKTEEGGRAKRQLQESWKGRGIVNRSKTRLWKGEKGQDDTEMKRQPRRGQRNIAASLTSQCDVGRSQAKFNFSQASGTGCTIPKLLIVFLTFSCNLHTWRAKWTYFSRLLSKTTETGAENKRR
jgi:hypothetical protein